MNRTIRVAGYIFLGLVLGLGIVVGALFVLTKTEFGLERVRRFALEQVGRRTQGELRVERIESAGLFGGVVLHGVTLNDSLGFPFLRADSIRLRYRWRNLIRGRVVFDGLVAYRPEVYLLRLPGDTLWNFERIFGSPTPEADGEDNFILIDHATIVDGLVVLRTPWTPDEPITEPDDTARLILEDIPGYGKVRVLRFESVDADLPRVLWESPVEEGKLFRIRRLSTRGYIWKTPFELQDLAGVVTIRDSLISFEASRFRLPGSRGSGVGRIILDDDNQYDIRIVGDEVQFADLQWLYPRFPDEGSGKLVFRIQSQPDGGILWLAQDAHIRAPGTVLRGDFGIVTGDTLYFTQVNLRASPIDLQLLADVLPVELPVEGLMVGTVVVEGPISSLSTEVDLRLTRAGGAESARLRGSGTLDLQAPFGVENLDATVAGLDLSAFPALRERMRGAGVFSGRVQATGRLDQALHLTTTIRHQLPGRAVSVVRGQGTVSYPLGGEPAVDATLEADSVALALLGVLVPALDVLRGDVTGPIRVRGPVSDLELEAELASAAGPVRFDARFDLSGARPRFAAEGRLVEFRLDSILPGIDETVLTARVLADATGDDDATHVRIELEYGWTGPIEFRRGSARFSMDDGLLRVDTLTLDSQVGRLDARGEIGLDAARQGELEVALHVDSLAALRWPLFGDAAFGMDDTVSARIGGSAFVRSTLRGSVVDLEADGEVRLDGVAYRAFDVGRADLRFAVHGIGTDSLRIDARGDASGAAVYGRPIDSAHGTLSYAVGVGSLEFEARGAEPVFAHYRLDGGFQRAGRGVEVRLHELRARDWIGDWRLASPARLLVGGDGIEVDDLRIERDDAAGYVYAAGSIPWRSDDEASRLAPLAANFRLDAENVPVSPLRVNGGGTQPSAFLTGTVSISGSAENPVMDATLALDSVVYQSVRIDRIGATLAYADRRLEGRLDASLDGRIVLTGNGQVPLDLALAPVAERRLDRSMLVRLRADGVPAAFVTGLVDGFRDVRGNLTGSMTIGGTPLTPELGGVVELRGGEAVWTVSGVRYRDVHGSFRVLDKQDVAIELSARAGGGTAKAIGTMTFIPLSDPTFNLTITANAFQLAQRRDVAATGSGRIRLTGRYSEPFLTGNIQVDRGELFLDEVWHQYNIVALDDQTLLSVVDTSIVAIRRTSNPFIRNLTIQDFTIDVDRDSWLRGRTLDVEVAGRLHVDFDRRAEELRMTGALNAIRGSYGLYITEELPVLNFAVREGVVEFDGTPGINPRLDIVGARRVRTEGGTLNVEAVVTGTLRNPRVSLRSDAQPPIAESDLLSLVLFGRPTSDIARLGALTGFGVGVATGAVSTGLQSLISDFGFVDYFAITEWEGSTIDGGGLDGIFSRSQVEIGRYLGQNWYVAFSSPLTTGQRPTELFGARVEWRFAPTWTGEFFWENRFLRGLSFHPTQQERVMGFFFFREWGF